MAMQNNPDIDIAEGVVDKFLSAQYQRLADETVPDSLDRMVLRAARNERTEGQAGRSRPAAWFRQAAWVAVAALSVAVILEFNEANVFSPPTGISDRVPPMEDRFREFLEAADIAAEQVRDAEAAAANATQNVGSSRESMPLEDHRSLETTLQPNNRECTSEQRAAVSSWWKCIGSLESLGATELAERELAALMGAFPGFAVPEK